jgi:trehalose 6-phosphate synthase
MRIGVLSRRAPIGYGADSGIAIEHVGGLTRVLPALAEFANINWTALTTQSQAGLPKHFSYSKLSNQRYQNQIDIFLAEVDVEALDRSDWFCAHYIWPLLHDLPFPEIGNSDLNQSFQAINEVSQAISMNSFDETNVGYLVNDFQLARVPIFLKEAEGNSQVTFFLHTPWPKSHPHNNSGVKVLQFLATGMLAADVIEFQTLKDLQAFEKFLIDYLPSATDSAKLIVNPVSVDVQVLQKQALEAVNQIDLRDEDISYVHIARSDPIKNTLATIAAFTQLALACDDTQPRRFLDLYIVPSRQQWAEYQDLLSEISTSVANGNSELAFLNYSPIRLHISNDYELTTQALLRYDYLLICSAADGLNLVVKEGAVLNSRNGVIVSTATVGAMAQLGNLCVVADGPDQDSIFAALQVAENLEQDTRHAMALQLKQQVEEFDSSRWAQTIMESFKILEAV